jgi:hypothetical protein
MQNCVREIFVKFALIFVLFTQSFPVFAAQEPPYYQEISTDEPEVGATNKTYLGERMFVQLSGKYIPCMTTDFEFQSGLFAKIFILKGGKMCSEGGGGYYKPEYTATTNEQIYPQSSIYFKVIRESNGLYKFCYKALCKKNINETDFYMSSKFIKSVDSMQRTIEYLGKTGNIVKFIYSEYSSGIARPAFSREFSIDLSETKTVMYGGSVFEIENATSNSITYKVVRGFSK